MASLLDLIPEEPTEPTKPEESTKSTNSLMDLIPDEEVDPKTGLAGESLIYEKAKASIVQEPRMFTGVDVESFQEYLGENINIELDDLVERRAKAQSTGEKWGRGTIKMIGTAATTFAEPFADLFIGIPQMVLEGRASAFYDNDITRGFDKFNDYLRDEFPNYYTKAEQESSVLEGLGYANFWADKALNGMGFVIGAVASGGLAATAKVGTNTAKLFNLLNKGYKTSKLSNTAAAMEAVEALPSLNRTNKFARAIDNFTTGGVSAAGESGIEARMTAKHIGEKLYMERAQGLNNYTDEEIESFKEAGGNIGFGINMVIVGGTNFLQFGKALTKGYKTEKRALNNLTKTPEGKYALKELTNFQKATKGTAIALKNPLYESSQEFAQFITEKGVGDYYTKKKDPEAENVLNSVIESFTEGLSETFGSKEGLESGLLGFILGIVGVPGVGGGVYGSIQESTRKTEGEKAIIDVLNKYSSTESFKALYEGAVRHISYQMDKDQALIDGDIFAYKTAENKQFKNYVKSRIDTGQYDLLLEELNELHKYSEEEFKATFGFLENEPLKKELSLFIDETINKVKEIKEISDKIESEYGDKPAIFKDLYFDALTSAKNVDKREMQLANRIAELVGEVDSRSLVEIMHKNNSWKFRENWLKEYHKKLKRLNAAKKRLETLKYKNLFYNALDTSKNAKRIEEQENKIKEKELELEEVKRKEFDARKENAKAIAPYERNFETFSEDVNNAVEKIDAIQKHYETDPLNKEELKELATDMTKLAERRQEIIDLHNELLDDEKMKEYETLEEEIIKDIEETAKEEVKKDEETVDTEETIKTDEEIKVGDSVFYERPGEGRKRYTYEGTKEKDGKKIHLLKRKNSTYELNEEKFSEVTKGINRDEERENNLENEYQDSKKPEKSEKPEKNKKPEYLDVNKKQPITWYDTPKKIKNKIGEEVPIYGEYLRPDGKTKKYIWGWDVNDNLITTDESKLSKEQKEKNVKERERIALIKKGFESDPEESSPEEVTPEEVETYNGTTVKDLDYDEYTKKDKEDGDIRIAYRSSTDLPSDKKSEEWEIRLTEFIENKIDFKGLPIEYILDEDYLNKNFKDLKKKINNNEELNDDDLKKLPIRVYLLNNKGERETLNNEEVYGYLNKSSASIATRYYIFDNHQNEKKSYSEIIEKKNGTLKVSEKTESKPLEELFDKEELDNLIFSVRDDKGILRTKKFIDENEKTIYVKNEELKYSIEGSPGAVYTTIETLNGSKIPLRLFSVRPNQNEAELIFDLYMKVLNTSPNTNVKLHESTINYIKNHEDPRISELSKIYDLNNLTYENFINTIIYEGKSTKGKNTTIYFDNKTIYFGNKGKDGKPNFFNINTAEKYKDDFIKFIQEKKIRQMDLTVLNNKEYKKYLIKNNILFSNAVPQPNGTFFVQPTIVLGENISNTLPKTTKEEEPTTTQQKSDVEKGFLEDLYVWDNDGNSYFATMTENKGKDGKIESVTIKRPLEEDTITIPVTSEEDQLIRKAKMKLRKNKKEGNKLLAEVGRKIAKRRLAELAALEGTTTPTNTKVDIERRRQEELNKEFGRDLELIQSERIPVISRQPVSNFDEDNARNLVNKLKEINAKYDTELAALEATQQPSDEGSIEDTFDDDAPFKLVKDDKNVYELDEMEVHNWLKKNLPQILNDKRLRFEDELIDGKAFGKWANQIITLSRKAPSKVIYHEAFHDIFRTYLTNKERTDILNAAKKRYNAPLNEDINELKIHHPLLSNEEIINLYYEEKLADSFEEYVAQGKTEKGIFAKIFDLLKQLINKVLNKKDKIDKLFKEINTGKFANNSMSLTTINGEAYKIPRPLNEFKQDEIEEITNVLTYVAVKPFIKSDFTDINEIDLNLIKPAIEKSIKANENNPLGKIYQSIYDNYEHFEQKIKSKLSSYGIKIDPELDPDEKGKGETYKETFTISIKEKASINTKLLIAFTPEVLDIVNGKPVYNKSKLLNLPKFVNYTSTWNTLEKHLSNIVSTPSQLDVLPVMIQKINELAEYKPAFKYISSYLSSPKISEYKKTQFVVTLQNTRVNFTSSFLNVIDEYISYKIGNSDTLSRSNIILSEWENAFIKSLFKTNKKGEISLNREFANEILKEYSELRRSKESLDIKKNKLINILNSIGINITDDVINFYINQIEKTYEDGFYELLNNDEIGLIHIFVGKGNSISNLLNKKVFENEEKDIVTPITDEKGIKEFSKYALEFRTDIQDNVILGPEGNSYWLYSKFDYMNQFFTEIKEDPSLLEDLMKAPILKNSRWANWLLSEENRNLLTIELFNNFKEENAGHEGNKWSDIEETDEHIDRIMKAVNGKYSYLNPADKPRQYSIAGPTFINHKIRFKKGKYIIDDQILDIFIDYFIDELNTSKLAYKNLFDENGKRNDKNKHLWILDYHYKEIDGKKRLKDKKGNLLGDVFKSMLFPELNYGTELANELGIYKKIKNKGEPFTINDEYINEEGELIQSFKDKLRPVINEILNSENGIIKEHIKYSLSDSKIITTEGEIIKNKSIPNDLITKYKEEYSTSESVAIREILADVEINQTMAHIELSKILLGDPRMFGSIKSLRKRASGPIATGDQLRISEKIEVRPNYNQATIQGVVKPSKVFTDNTYLKKVSEVADVKINKLKDILKAYNKVNQTDAQAWITVDRWVEIKRGLGEWTDELDKALPAIKNGTANFAELKLFAEPIKGQHWEVTRHLDTLMPIYLKYSQAPLLPNLVKGTELEVLLEAMERNKTDEVVVNDGVKVGITDLNKVFDKDGKILPSLKIELTNKELSNRFWKRQQIIPHKGMKSMLVPSQPKKNILVNIQLNEDYSGKTGEERAQEIHDIDSSLSNDGKQKLLRKWAVDEETGKANVDAVYDSLIEQARKDDDQNLIEALEKRLPFDAIPSHRKKIESKLVSAVTKATVKTKQLGGGYIQMSNAMFNKIEKSSDLFKNAKQELILLKDINELEPAKIITNEEGKDVIKPGQVFLPHNIWKKIKNHPSNEKLSEKELINKIKKSPEILEIIGFRIPNQATSSTDLLEIVGFLPESSGDTIVAYTEITTKTGSDFDIDKMYVIMPNYNIDKNGNPHYIKYMTEENSTLTERVEQLLRSPQDLIRIFGKESTEFIIENLEKVHEYIRDIIKDKTELKESEDFLNIINEIERKNEEKKFLIQKKKETTSGKSALQKRINNLILSIDSLWQETGILEYNEALNNLYKAKEENIINKIEKSISNLPIIEQNIKAARENRRIELYKIILSDPKTYLDLINPLDEAWLQEDIEEIIDKKPIEGLNYFTLRTQMEDNRVFNAGMAGRGQSSNQLVDHAISQRGKKYLKDYYIGKGNAIEDGSDLSQIYGDFEILNEEGDFITIKKPISQIISSYLSAYIDIAKDDFITRGNHNTQTANTVFLMLRAGISPQFVNRFINQPIIRDYVKEINYDRARNKKEEYEYGRRINALDRITKKWAGERLDKDDIPVIDLSEIKTKQLNKEHSKQLEILGKFLELRKKASKLSESISASKADVNGAHKNLMEAYIVDSLKNKVSLEDEIGNWDKMFDNTMLGTYHNDSVVLVQTLLEDFFLSQSSSFKNALKLITNLTQKDILSDVYKGDLINEELLAVVLSNSELNLSKEEMGKVFFGMESLARKLKAAQQKNSPIKDNLFIDFLTPEIDYTNRKPSFISINNTKTMPMDTQNKLFLAWEELYYSENEKTKQFAIDLLKYTYYTSGFRNNLRTFHKLIPSNLIQELNLENYIKEIRPSLLINNDLLVGENVIDQIFKNNWKNTNLVPKISKKVALSIPNIKKTEAFSLNKFSGSKYILGEDLNEMPAYIPFLNYKDNLYKFVGIKNFINFNEKTLKETYEQRAIYIKTNKLGYNHRGKRIVEYDIHDTGKESFYLPNNVKHDQKIESLYYSIEYYPSSTEEMIEETTIPSVQPQADNNPLNYNYKIPYEKLVEVIPDSKFGALLTKVDELINDYRINLEILTKTSDSIKQKIKELETNFRKENLLFGDPKFNLEKWESLRQELSETIHAELKKVYPALPNLEKIQSVSAQPQGGVEYNYNPSNVSEEVRNNNKQYVLDKLGKPISINFETKDNDSLYKFTFSDGLIIETPAKGKMLSFPKMSEKVAKLSKEDPGYDIKFLIGLNKLAEETTTQQEDDDIWKDEDNDCPIPF